MNQSSVIGASLLIAYVIFIITKGELPCYLSLLGIATATGCPPNLQPAGCGGTGTATSSSIGGSPSVGITLGGGSPSVGITLPTFGGLGNIGSGGIPPILGGPL
jgi:hypothetical protein